MAQYFRQTRLLTWTALALATLVCGACASDGANLVDQKVNRQTSRVGDKIDNRVDDETDAAVDGVVNKVLDRVF